MHMKPPENSVANSPIMGMSVYKQSSEFNEALKQRAVLNLPKLIGVSLAGCAVCAFLKYTLLKVVADYDFQDHEEGLENGFLTWFEVERTSDLKEVGLTIQAFPTLLAIVNNKVVAGWEGFAVLESAEIRKESVSQMLDDFISFLDIPAPSAETRVKR
jgi:hypothetical protein